MNDLNPAFRQLARNSGFTIVAILTIALGIGAVTAVRKAVAAIDATVPVGRLTMQQRLV